MAVRLFCIECANELSADKETKLSVYTVSYISDYITAGELGSIQSTKALTITELICKKCFKVTRYVFQS